MEPCTPYYANYTLGGKIMRPQPPRWRLWLAKHIHKLAWRLHGLGWRVEGRDAT